MITNGFLIYVESANLLLIKEKMKCVKCNGEIIFQDKIDYIDVKCKDCAEEYRIRHGGLWHVEKNKGISLYIGIKHLNRLRYWKITKDIPIYNNRSKNSIYVRIKSIFSSKIGAGIHKNYKYNSIFKLNF